MDANLRHMLEQLSRSLFEAISDSGDVHDHLKRLRAEGYSLNLLLDCQPDTEKREENQHRELATRSTRTVHRSPSPEFKINCDDLAFLRSVGIDPTRQLRNKKTRRPNPPTA